MIYCDWLEVEVHESRNSCHNFGHLSNKYSVVNSVLFLAMWAFFRRPNSMGLKVIQAILGQWDSFRYKFLLNETEYVFLAPVLANFEKYSQFSRSRESLSRITQSHRLMHDRLTTNQSRVGNHHSVWKEVKIRKSTVHQQRARRIGHLFLLCAGIQKRLNRFPAVFITNIVIIPHDFSRFEHGLSVSKETTLC